MKTFLVLTLCILMSSFASAGMLGFGVQATGASLNVAEPLKSVYGTGFGGGAHLDINLPVLFSIRVAADYTVYSPDNGKYQSVIASIVPGSAASDFTLDGGKISIFSVSANGKMSVLPLPVLSPYITGGVGIGSISFSDVTVKQWGNPIGTVPGPSTGTNASVNFGVGVDLNVVVTLYLEAKYTVIFTQGESSSFIPVSLGITF